MNLGRQLQMARNAINGLSGAQNLRVAYRDE
jgi:hypothetical protein